MIYKKFTNTEMIAALLKDHRSNWTYDQAEALADYYETLSEDLGEHLEWNSTLILFTWSAYDSFDQIKEFYSLAEDDEMEDLQDNTVVLECADDTILVQEF